MYKRQILLLALAASGLLLTTNFSFIGFYEKIIAALGTRFAFVETFPNKIKAWREARREAARLRKEKKLALKAEQEAARNALNDVRSLSGAARVAEFMKENDAVAIVPSASVVPAENSFVRSELMSTPSSEPARAAAAAAGVQGATGATVVESHSGRRSIFPGAGFPGTGSPGAGVVGVLDEELEVEEMVKGVVPLLEVGVNILGACCGSTPAHIAAFRKVMDEYSKVQA